MPWSEPACVEQIPLDYLLDDSLQADLLKIQIPSKFTGKWKCSPDKWKFTEKWTKISIDEKIWFPSIIEKNPD